MARMIERIDSRSMRPWELLWAIDGLMKKHDWHRSQWWVSEIAQVFGLTWREAKFVLSYGACQQMFVDVRGRYMRKVH
jgi:hypothetical protein